ncbi:MAG: DUF1080 domain-containing protein [Pirellulales bacterium]|nr:DUF1080 domain-containing protein [Pirellulales bacterium]
MIIGRTWAQVFVCWCTLACAWGAGAPADDDFSPIFDGRTLDGWRGQDDSFWTVEDEAITGTIRPDHRPSLNQYLVWQGGLVEDFELQLEFRLTGSTTPDTNGGFQFRSRRLPNGDVAGYQVDNNFGQPWRARLYYEFGRHDLAREGERARFLPTGERSVEALPVASSHPEFRLDEWHEYHLIAVGPHLQLFVNGNLIAEVFDDDPDSFEPRGILAMQLHTGPPMKAQFRKLRLKRLQTASAASREALLADAALAWDLGERASAHQPPLATVGGVAVEQVSAALRALPGERVARLDDGYFHAQVDLNAPRAWSFPGEALTVHVRAYLPEASSPRTLVAKGSTAEALNFRLGEAQAGGDNEPTLQFTVGTASGTFSAGFPLAKIDRAAWHDFVGRYDGQQIEIYCDGQRLDQRPASGALRPSAAPILLGAATDDEEIAHGFQGELATITLWPRALTDAELRLLVPQTADTRDASISRRRWQFCAQRTPAAGSGASRLPRATTVRVAPRPGRPPVHAGGRPGAPPRTAATLAPAARRSLPSAHRPSRPLPSPGCQYERYLHERRR